MSRVTPPMGALLLACLSGWQVANALVEKVPPQKPSLYIGIENNRRPYAYFDDKHQAQGFLVATIQSACQQLDLSCRFVGGLPEKLLLALQNIKLNAVLILDAALPPEADALNLTHPANIDHLKLTRPVCQLAPAFLHKKRASARTGPEDFRGTNIGVQEGTIFHSYLLAQYGSVAHIKPYPLPESAIVDLVFDRLDAVLGDKAFFKARVFDSALDEYAGLTMEPVDKPGLATNTSIVLAVRERDTDLLKQLDGALTAASQTKTCVELLATVPVKRVKK